MGDEMDGNVFIYRRKWLTNWEGKTKHTEWKGKSECTKYQTQILDFSGRGTFLSHLIQKK